MAGTPKQKKFREDVERAGGDYAVFDRFANGESLISIMQSYGLQSLFVFYEWLKDGGPERQKLYDEAKKMSAQAHVHNGLTIVDGVPLGSTTADVRSAESRANFRMKIATSLDPDTFGEQQKVRHEVSGDDRWLEALTNFGKMPAPAAIPALPVVTKDAELIEDDGNP